MEIVSAVSRPEIELIEAVRRGDLLGAAFLIDNGVDVNLKNSQDGSSLLHWACKSNNYAMVSLLLSRGADKSFKNKFGQIARDMTSSAEVATLLQGNDSPCSTPPFRSFVDRGNNDLPYNMVNRNDLHNQRYIAQDILLKVRIANSPDPDFIEIELPHNNATYQMLLTICCQELEINLDQVSRIRKLPDTRIRSDADVKRLNAMQELEVVLKDNISCLSSSISANIYPSISANKNQTVLY